MKSVLFQTALMLLLSFQSFADFQTRYLSEAKTLLKVPEYALIYKELPVTPFKVKRNLRLLGDEARAINDRIQDLERAGVGAQLDDYSAQALRNRRAELAEIVDIAILQVYKHALWVRPETIARLKPGADPGTFNLLGWGSWIFIAYAFHGSLKHLAWSVPKLAGDIFVLGFVPAWMVGVAILSRHLYYERVVDPNSRPEARTSAAVAAFNDSASTCMVALGDFEPWRK